MSGLCFILLCFFINAIFFLQGETLIKYYLTLPYLTLPYLTLLKHKTVSVKYIINLFDTLVKPVLTYGSAMYGIQNCMVVETFYLKFLKKILKIKTSTNTCMIYAETGRYPMSIDTKLNMINAMAENNP